MTIQIYFKEPLEISTIVKYKVSFVQDADLLVLVFLQQEVFKAESGVRVPKNYNITYKIPKQIYRSGKSFLLINKGLSKYVDELTIII